MAKTLVDDICQLLFTNPQVYCWSDFLYQAMDINLSMFLDRPPHVQGRLCNVPPLSEADFEQVGSQETEPSRESFNEANTFAINAVQLARTGSTSHHPVSKCTSLLRNITVDRYFTLKFEEDTGHSQDICLETNFLVGFTPFPGIQVFVNK
jgi:hypothetical protein